VGYVRDRIAARRKAARAHAQRAVATYIVLLAAVPALLIFAVAYSWPLLERARLGRAVSAGSGDPNARVGIDDYRPPPKLLRTKLAPQPTEMALFRGNPGRNLSGVGKVPRRPKLLWRFQTHTKLEGPYEKRGSTKVNDSTPWSGLGWTGQPDRRGGRYYFGSADSYVYCLDAASGACVWYYPNHHCVKGSIATFGDRIYHGGRDNKIHCYTLDGQMVWETRTGNDMDSSPVVFEGLGYIGGEDHYAYCFNPKSGKIVWKHGPMKSSFENSPCISDKGVLFGDGQGEFICLERKTGQLIWQANTMGDTDSTPAYYKGRIYVGCATGDDHETGHLWCLDSATGKSIWHVPFPRGFWSSPSLNVDLGRLYIGNADGYFYALSMSDGATVWKRNVHARVWGSAAVSDGCVVFGVRDGRLWCLSEDTGEPLWVFDTPGDIDSTPCVSGGQILTGDQQGNVYCIGEAEPGEAVNTHWFVTRYPQTNRLDHDPSGIPLAPNPAPEPGTYQDTHAGCRDHYLVPVPGPAYE
jgi:outer membrane protein assembly factor BamB